MKVNFSEIKVQDLEGREVVDLYKTIANVIFRSAKTLDLVEIARAINRAEEVDLRPSELKEIRQLIGDPQTGIFAFARKAMFDFIDAVVPDKEG